MIRGIKLVRDQVMWSRFSTANQLGSGWRRSQAMRLRVAVSRAVIPVREDVYLSVQAVAKEEFND